MTFSFRVYKEILDLFEKNSLLGATQISQKLEISRPIIHKVLNHLLMEKKIEKVGIASHTRYKSLIFSGSNILNSNKVLGINSIKENSDDFIVDFKTKKLLDDNFYKFDSDGSLLIGFFGFKKWVKSRNFDLEKSILNFKNIYNYIENIENNCGVLESTDIFNKKFDKNYMQKVFYAGEYSFMEFGRSKLAEMTFYAKQSQDSSLINQAIDEVFYKLECIIKTQKIDAIAIVPWSIDRKNQLLNILKNRLKELNIPFINIIKYYPNNISIPQKSIKSKDGRIKNATNTIFVYDNNVVNFSKILLIDDFVGSGSTLNITAKKLLESNAKEVLGFSFVGSMDLTYEVINEI